MGLTASDASSLCIVIKDRISWFDRASPGALAAPPPVTLTSLISRKPLLFVGSDAGFVHLASSEGGRDS